MTNNIDNPHRDEVNVYDYFIDSTRRAVNNPSEIWTLKLAESYKGFAAKLKSDLPAYLVLVDLIKLIIKGKYKKEGKDISEATIIDFGCYDGSSTSLYKQTGANVIGIDINKSTIKDAEVNYGDAKTSFIHINPDEQIPFSNTADIVVMTFVHSTIEDLGQLYDVFKKIYSSMKAGGVLLILGLNIDSFNNKYEFESYRHNKVENQFPIEDGRPFLNVLVGEDGERLEFHDIYWSEETIEFALLSSGFQSIGVFPLRNDLEGPVGSVLRDVLKDSLASGNTYKNEWSHGLHLLITAAKPNGNNQYLPEIES